MRECTHCRIRRREVTDLPWSAAEAAVRVLAPLERLDEASLCGRVELAIEESERVHGPVQDPRSRGVEAGEVLGERGLEEASEVGRVDVSLQLRVGGRSEVFGQERRDALLCLVLSGERL